MADTALAAADAERQSGRSNLTGADAVDQVRRFAERWNCDRGFREEVAADPQRAAAARGLVLNPEDLRIMWDDDFRSEVANLAPCEALKKITPLGLIWLELQQRSRARVMKARTECAPADARFAAWRRKEIQRCDRLFRPLFADVVPHIPFAIELSKGCSVGCWFCGVSAPRLDGHYRYTNENSESFRKILQSLAHIAGRSAGKWGVLYWATDPLDHPDYERFCSDFAAEFGVFPTTTTALGWKDMPRMRNLIRRASADGAARVRLSVLNLKILDLYLSELTPRELAAVGFQPVNKESILPTSTAGRALRHRPNNWTKSPHTREPETSIACMSGFLFNLPDKTIRLISPCPADARWPDGYIVYDETTFTDADSVHVLLERMIKRSMREAGDGMGAAVTSAPSSEAYVN